MKRRDFLKCGLVVVAAPVAIATAKSAAAVDVIEPLASMSGPNDFDEFLDRTLRDLAKTMDVPYSRLVGDGGVKKYKWLRASYSQEWIDPRVFRT